MQAYPVKWALLCGCDFYFEGTARDGDGRQPRYKHLQGCVRDVEDMYDLLIKLGVEEKRIIKLTARCGNGQPEEPGWQWPTKANMERAFQRIKAEGQPGELLYIHYSGHGIRRDRLPSQLREEEEGDTLMGTALVMTDVLLGKPYLTGYQLGVWVRELVEKYKLRVTVVLDSCFSGGGLRAGEPWEEDGFAPRTIVDAFDASELPCDRETNEATDDANPDFSSRDPTAIRKCWLSRPTGCTVLTACAYHEVAGERRFANAKYKNGVLTYWILKRLEQSLMEMPTAKAPAPDPAQVVSAVKLPSHIHVVDFVRSQIGAAGTQTPTIQGDGSYEFFGPSSSVESNIFYQEACHVVGREGSEIHLDVGAIQGVALGAIYDIFPGDSVVALGDEPPTQARVTVVYYAASKAVLLHDDRTVAVGWFAVLRTWALPTAVHVEVKAELSNARRSELKRCLEVTPNLFLSAGDADSNLAVGNSTLQVQIDSDGYYEIFQMGRRLPRLPRIPSASDWGAKGLAQILSHVARFQALQRLKNLPRSLRLRETDFTFHVGLDSQPAEQTAPGIVTVKEKQPVTLSVTFNGQNPNTWVSVFCFTASWGICRFDPTPDSGQAAYPAWLTSPGTTTMEIPPKSRPNDPAEIEDSFVMYASVGAFPISWGDICLPPLTVDEPASGSPSRAKRFDAEVGRNPADVKKEPLAATPDWTVLERRVRTIPAGEM